TYWKNGVPVKLADTNLNSAAYAIAVKGKDVYIAGYVSTGSGLGTPTYWKNGVPTSVTDFSTFATAGFIAVTDSAVYLGGSRDNGVPAYWKNGVPMEVVNASPGSYVYSMAVSNNDVYLLAFDNYSQHLKLWKNGIPSPVNFPASVVAAKGADIYLAGSSSSIATYWKNNIPVTLPGVSPSLISALTFNGDDVYAAGITNATNNSSVATYWHNSLEVPLASSSSLPFPTCIAVNGNDVYVAGYNLQGAVYWNNGKEIQLTTKKSGTIGTSGYASGIAVVPR
ncbi:MAG: hypothetical protein ACXVJV_17660, partial [Mucilaginibacter sp.]